MHLITCTTHTNEYWVVMSQWTLDKLSLIIQIYVILYHLTYHSNATLYATQYRPTEL
jgi:hypothetical protein